MNLCGNQYVPEIINAIKQNSALISSYYTQLYNGEPFFEFTQPAIAPFNFSGTTKAIFDKNNFEFYTGYTESNGSLLSSDSSVSVLKINPEYIQLISKTIELSGFVSGTSLNLSNIPNGSTSQNILTLNSSGLIEFRTPAQILTDIGAGSPSGGALQGTGTINYIPRWTGVANLGISQIFDNNTNVGIGTTTPGEKLTVTGNLSSSGVHYAAGGNSNIWNTSHTIVQTNSANWILDGGNTKNSNLIIGSNNNFGLSFETNNVIRATITNTGDVGIGVTAPNEKLTIAGNLSATGTSYLQDLNLQGNFSVTGSVSLANVTVGGTGRALIATIDNTTLPTTGGGGPLFIESSNTTSSAVASILFGSRDSGNTGRHAASITVGKESDWPGGGGQYPGYMSFWSRPTSGSQVERIRITGSGNVGIGTSTPGQRLTLQVPSTPTSIGNFRITDGSRWLQVITNSSPEALNKLVGSGDTSLIFSRDVLNTGNLVIGANTDPTRNAGLRIQSNGNFGINQPTPVTTLDIINSSSGEAYTNTPVKIGDTEPIYFVNNSPAIGFNTYLDSPNWKYGLSSAGKYGGFIQFNVNTGSTVLAVSPAPGNADAAYAPQTLLTVLNNGNTGLGVSTPSVKLDVAGSILTKVNNDTDVNLRLQRFSGAGRAQLTFETQTGAQIWRLGLTSGGATAFNFFDGTQNRLVLQQNGNIILTPANNVGVNTSTPNESLTVAGSISATNIVHSSNITIGNNPQRTGTLTSQHNTSGQLPVGVIRCFSTGTNNSVVVGGGDNSVNAITDLQIYTASNTTTSTGIERVRVTGNGNVGIGTSVPDKKIECVIPDQGIDGIRVRVENNSGVIDLRPNSTAGTDNGLIQAGDQALIVHTNSVNTGSIVIGSWTNRSQGSGIRITNSNTTTPSTITIKGNISYQDRPIAGSGTALVIGSDNLIKPQGSSIRFKDNIQPYTTGLDKIMLLRPVTFNYKNENVVNAGLVAEELDKLGLQEYVTRDENGKPFSIPYGNIVALLINGIKELKKEIEDLKKQ